MSEQSALIFAKTLMGTGSAQSHDDIGAAASTDGPTWYHFDANHPAAGTELRQHFPDIDEYTLQAILDETSRPRILQLDTGVLLILRGINHNKGDDPEDMIAVRLWITASRLISLRYRKSRALIDVSESLDRQHGPRSIGDTVVAICSLLFGYIEETIAQLEEEMDGLESRVVDEPNKQLRQDIAHIRKSAILLRRYIAPQKDVLNQLRYADFDWISSRNARRIQETQDTLLRCVEELDAIRERSQVVKDELVNALSDRLNRNLYVISVVTAIFLPLGFLTGLFGINIGGMPGVDQDNAFTLFAMGLGVIVAVQIVLFKLFKWF